MLKVTVVTINYNSSFSIQRTINSFLGQDYENLEWVVVDGASSDESLSILTNHLHQIDKFISEKDRGIAHAMNKGLELASGDVVIYMNAGDAFSDEGAISRIIASWRYSDFSWITAGVEVYSESEELIYARAPHDSSWEDLLKRGCRVTHPSTYVKTSVLKSSGGFSEEFQSSMDYELWLRLVAGGHYPQIVSIVASKFYLGGTSGGLLRRFKEDRLARHKNGFKRWGVDVSCLIIAVVKIGLGRMFYSKYLYKFKEFLGV